MLKLLRFNPYLYEIWYQSKLDEMGELEDDELDKKIDELVAGNEFKPLATCDDVEIAFVVGKKALEVADFKDYETLHINKINTLTGQIIGSYIYSKTQNDFIFLEDKLSLWQHAKSRIALKFMILRVSYTVKFWLFRQWLSTPLYFIVGLLLIIYLFMTAPAETLLKVMNKGEEFNDEMNGFMERLDKPLFITSIFVYAFIIFEIIKHVL